MRSDSGFLVLTKSPSVKIAKFLKEKLVGVKRMGRCTDYKFSFPNDLPIRHSVRVKAVTVHASQEVGPC